MEKVYPHPSFKRLILDLINTVKSFLLNSETFYVCFICIIFCTMYYGSFELLHCSWICLIFHCLCFKGLHQLFLLYYFSFLSWWFTFSQYQDLNKKCEEMQEKFSHFEQEDVRVREGLKHGKGKAKKLEKVIEAEKKKVSYSFYCRRRSCYSVFVSRLFICLSLSFWS